MADQSPGHSGPQELCRGRYVRLISNDSWEYAERVGAGAVVAIVPVLPGLIILTEQYRKAVDSRVIDLPAGLVDELNDGQPEEFAVAARRELVEETGYEAAELTHVATCPSSPGLTAEIVTIYLASGLTRVHAGGGDDSEQITVHEAPLASIDDWLAEKTEAGILVDPKVYAGLYFASR